MHQKLRTFPPAQTLCAFPHNPVAALASPRRLHLISSPPPDTSKPSPQSPARDPPPSIPSPAKAESHSKTNPPAFAAKLRGHAVIPVVRECRAPAPPASPHPPADPNTHPPPIAREPTSANPPPFAPGSTITTPILTNSSFTASGTYRSRKNLKMLLRRPSVFQSSSKLYSGRRPLSPASV